MELSVYVNGMRGRMGQAIQNIAALDPALSLCQTLEQADVALDFSAPAALKNLLEKCAHHKKPVVIGTTGHAPESKADLLAASQHIPILFSPNFSLGVAVSLEAAKLIGQHLQGLCQIEIVEAHHQTKKDRPSGTALALAKAAGCENAPIHSIRAGDIVGEHTIYFVMGGERIELKHHAQSRDAFARGALLAAKFLKTKPPGFYTIKDMLHEPR